MSSAEVPESARAGVEGLNEAIAHTLRERGIDEILHFTTSRGLIGILATQLLQARSHLTADKYLEHIYVPNTKVRRENPKYWRYVNMSITRPNVRLFQFSQGWRKADSSIHWVILAFDSCIATHAGVRFATSNMMHDGVEAEEGSDAFHALFADPCHDGYGRMRHRPRGLSDSLPTNEQAELLYPDRVSTSLLRRIYVSSEDDAAHVEGIVGVLNHNAVEVVVQPDIFGP